MKKAFARVFALGLLCAVAAPAFAQDAAPAKIGTTDKGKVFTDAKGMTLYTTDWDKPGGKGCTGGCATNWPAFVAPADAKASGDWTAITKPDGTKQWAYKGMPVYTWSKDQKPGDATGDGVAKVWHVAQPS